MVHICSEMEPVVLFGSLASYVTGLSCALQRKGNLVEVILPKYVAFFCDLHLKVLAQTLMNPFSCN